MRHHLEILNNIDNLLSDNGLEEERIALKKEVTASTTGSELCLRSGSLLLTLQKSQSRLSIVAEDLIKEFISYCHAHGLYPKPQDET